MAMVFWYFLEAAGELWARVNFLYEEKHVGFWLSRASGYLRLLVPPYPHGFGGDNEDQADHQADRGQYEAKRSTSDEADDGPAAEHD